MSNVLTQTLFGNELLTTMSLESAINLLLAKNLINVGELAEQAISKKSGVAMCGKNTANIDLVSGVQVKYSTVTMPASSIRYLAYISINTTAPILCVITNPIVHLGISVEIVLLFLLEQMDIQDQVNGGITK